MMHCPGTVHFLLSGIAKNRALWYNIYIYDKLKG